MKKRLLECVLPLMFLSACAPKAERAERIFENDVEVVINHLAPYKVKGETATLELEKELSIDFSREDMAKLGLADIYNFNIDSRGNIYVLNGKPVEYFIFSFDRNGHFLKSLGKKGQGPGELQWTLSIAFDRQDNVIVADPSIRKNVVFDPQGNLIRETAYPKDVYALYPLDNDKYIAYWRKYTTPEADYFDDYFGLSGPGLEGVRVLDSCQWPNPRKYGVRGNRLNRVFNWKTSGSRRWISKGMPLSRRGGCIASKKRSRVTGRSRCIE